MIHVGGFNQGEKTSAFFLDSSALSYNGGQLTSHLSDIHP